MPRARPWRATPWSAGCATRGSKSEVAFQAFDAGGFSGSLRVGPAKDPDLTAEVAEIRYDLLGFWNGQPLGARVTQVRLLNPTIRARWHDGKLSLGSLDPLIEKLSKRPPAKDKGQPKIEIDGASLRLDTDYGPLATRLISAPMTTSCNTSTPVSCLPI